MGLQNQLNDVAADSIPLFLIALIASCVNQIRSLIFGLLHSVGLSLYGSDDVEEGILGAVGSGLAGLIVLSEQLNRNRKFSFSYRERRGVEEKEEDGRVDVDGRGGRSSDCVVCLSRLRDGEQVRELMCGHVFHKKCFDGWLDHMNFNCPLCRSPLVSDERVNVTRRRVAGDLAEWFAVVR